MIDRTSQRHSAHRPRWSVSQPRRRHGIHVYGFCCHDALRGADPETLANRPAPRTCGYLPTCLAYWHGRDIHRHDLNARSRTSTTNPTDLLQCFLPAPDPTPQGPLCTPKTCRDHPRAARPFAIGTHRSPASQRSPTGQDLASLPEQRAADLKPSVGPRHRFCRGHDLTLPIRRQETCILEANPTTHETKSLVSLALDRSVKRAANKSLRGRAELCVGVGVLGGANISSPS